MGTQGNPIIGYIGLGLMGKPIARNILNAGYSLVVHNRSQKAVEELVALGATAATNPKEIAEQVDIVFTNLPDSPDVEEVALGRNGLIDGVEEGMVFVDNSTIKPETARHIAQEFGRVGVDCLDAPVSGGDVGAINGTLAIMVGGPESAFNRVMPIFEVIGKSIVHVGDEGAGQIAKAANQIMVAAQMVAMAELLILAKKAGADPQKVANAIKGGAAQCWALDVKPDRLFAGNRSPGFKAYMQLKDLGIVLDTGREYGVPLPSTAVNTQLFSSLIQLGLGDLDNSAVIAVMETLASQTLLE